LFSKEDSGKVSLSQLRHRFTISEQFNYENEGRGGKIEILSGDVKESAQGSGAIKCPTTEVIRQKVKGLLGWHNKSLCNKVRTTAAAFLWWPFCISTRLNSTNDTGLFADD